VIVDNDKPIDNSLDLQEGDHSVVTAGRVSR
jgi:hypothetical protein